MIIAVDIGGTHERVARFQGSELLEVQKNNSNPNYKTGLAELISRIEALKGADALDGIGISFPGEIDTEQGRLINFYHLEQWEHQPLAEVLAEHFKVPVKMQNDAVAAALGEKKFGHGQDLNKFIYLSWGTGLGGCFVEQQAGTTSLRNIEAGHQIIELHGKKCECEQLGCLETYVGGKQIEQQYGVSPKHLTDPAAWQDICQRLAQAILSMRVLFDTRHFIMGGGLINRKPELIDPVNELVKNKSSKFSSPLVILSDHGENANLYGAAALL